MPAATSRARGARPARGAPATRLGAWVALAAVLALPAGARAANRTFAINSLIIPVQIEYQEDQGVIGAYGLVYSVLRRNPERIAAGQRPVTFYWSIAPNKLSQYRCNTDTNALPRYDAFNDNDGCDFAVQSAAGSPVALLMPDGTSKSPFGTAANEYVYQTAYTVSGGPARGSTYLIDASKTVVKYLGGGWVVDATDRQAFIDMLAQYPELAQYRNVASATYVRIHSAQTSFVAPVARTLKNKPPLIAVANTSGASFLTDVLGQAGLNQIPNWNAAPPDGQVYELVDASTNQISTTLATLFSSNVSFLNKTWPHGYVNSGRYGLVWMPDPGASAFTLDADQVSNLSRYADQGTGAYVEASSIDGVENAGDYQTPTGIGAVNPNIAYYEDCNDRMLPSGSFYLSTKTGTCFQYGGISQPYGQTGNFAFEGGQGNYKGFWPLVGFLAGVDQVLTKVDSGGNQTLTSARYKDNDQTKGLVYYMSGHKYQNARYWGQRLIMDSVLSNVPLVVGVELSRSEPVGYVDHSGSTPLDHVYQGTYVQLPDPITRDVDTYNVGAPQRWQFPYTRGHLYEYDLSRISTGAGQNFSANSNWDAGARMPLPGSRTIFTMLGGSAQLGWKAVNWWYDQTGSACANKDAAGNCLLSAALAACGTAGITSGTLLPANDGTTAGQTQRNRLGMFVQQVRGFCSAHVGQVPTGDPFFQPTDAQCDDTRQLNLAFLGGVDHGSAALVGPSRYVTDAPWSSRPVVAYVGARDGMLHAIYVSGGSGFAADGKALPSGIQAGTELWAFIPPGQICGTGTGGLFSNDAMVDASVNVIDVFGNFPSDKNNDGVIDWAGSSDPNLDERPNGIKRWRTVLLAAVGQGGSELFAMDVTNPLKPVLLWHVAGPTEKDGRWDANANGTFGDAGDVFDPNNPRTYAVKWLEATDSSGLSAVNGVSQVKTGRFDYRNLGLAYGTAVGKLWEGNAFTYVAYVATNTADFTNPDTPLGYKGIEIFAIDLVTGQKIWQWERRYARATSGGVVIADNTIPGRPALADVDADGSVDRIYVGDIEGHLWELEAHAGGNMNYLQPKDSRPPPNQKYYSFPLFGTPRMTGDGTASDGTTADASTKALVTLASGGLAQQPLTSPVGLGRFTAVPSSPSTLADFFPNRLAVLQGTMGVDWAIAPFEKGNMFVIPVYWESNSRLAYWYNSAAPQPELDIGASPDPRAFGLIKPEAQWQIQLGIGERIFGMPRVVNNQIVFNTAFGSFSGDISDTILDRGNLYIVKSGGTGVEQIPSKAFGGALVFQNKLVVSTATGIKAKSEPSVSGGGPSQMPFNRASPAVFKTWEPPSSTGRPQ